MFFNLQALKQKLSSVVVVVVAATTTDRTVTIWFVEESRKQRERKAPKQQQLNRMGFLRGGAGAMDADSKQIRGWKEKKNTKLEREKL